MKSVVRLSSHDRGFPDDGEHVAVLGRPPFESCCAAYQVKRGFNVPIACVQVALEHLAPPVTEIRAAEGSSGFSSQDAFLSLTFLLSKPSNNFNEDAVDILGGTLVNLTAINETTYTAKFMPIGGTGLRMITVSALGDSPYHAQGPNFEPVAYKDLLVTRVFKWNYLAPPLGTTATRVASSCSDILAESPHSPSGPYWIDISGDVGPRQLHCDMRNGGWMLVMRGKSDDDLPYGDNRWTSPNDDSADHLLDGRFGAFAKSVASTSYYKASRILVVAEGFSGYGGGSFGSFEFDFGNEADSPGNLMFSTQHAMSWNSSYALWRSTFGQDRTENPSFQRYGSSANQTVGEDRGLKGCGQPIMFGFQAHDGPNDVNSGLGTNDNYCGGNPSGFSRGSWMGSGGRVQIWMK